MRVVKRIVCMLLTMTIVFTNLSVNVFAAEADSTEYGQIILNPAEGTSLLNKDGEPLENDLITFDDKEGYWYEVGARLEFIIEVEPGYKQTFESFDNANGGGSVDYDADKELYYGIVAAGENTIQTWSEADDSYIGKNAISSSDNWQENMFNLMGFASTVGGGNNKYFSEESTAAEGTVFWFLNMTDELQYYVDEEGYVNVSYENYMNIVEAYYVNAPDMETYLTKYSYMNTETEQIHYYLGGLGDAWQWVLCDVQDYNNGYKLRGIFCSGEVTDKTGLTEYVDYYDGLYIDSAVELYVVDSEEHGWQIAAYTELDYYKVEDYGNMGEVLYVYNEDKENFSDVYYLIDIAQPEADVSVVLREGTYKIIDGMYCYSSDMTVTFDAVCGEGWTCQVEVERIVNGEPTIGTWGDTGIVYGGGSVCITPVPLALFTIDAEHAEVEVLQGLVDMQDGTYAYGQTAAIELKITPDEGYEISEVASFIYDDYVVFGQYISASGTWLIYPEFCPSTILVTAKDIADEVITIVSGDDSAEKVTVQVDAKDAEKVEGLTLVVEKLDSAEEEKSTTLILENVEAEDVYILDIYFENQDSDEVKVNAAMTVAVPIPEGWDADNIAVYYVNSETGEVTDMNAVMSEDGKTVSFITTHFSHYALVQLESSPAKEDETEGDKSSTESDKEDTTIKTDNDKEAPKTGDDSCLTLWGSILLISAITTGVLLKRRKADGHRAM